MAIIFTEIELSIEFRRPHQNLSSDIFIAQICFQIDASQLALLTNQIGAFWKSGNKRLTSKHRFENLAQHSRRRNHFRSIKKFVHSEGLENWI